MRDPNDDDGGGRAALILGFGEKGKSSSGLSGLMRALRRAFQEADDEQAARIFTEAVEVVESSGEQDAEEDKNPFGDDSDEDDRGSGLAF